MTPDDLLMLGTLAFISGISGMGLGYYIREVQVQGVLREIAKNMDELEYLADIIREEKENAD